MVVSIDRAVYLNGYKIEFDFSDGVRRTIDFEEFLKSAKNPMTKKYLNIDKFKNFSIEYGDIV